MKIIARSNFDNEQVSDKLIAENVDPNFGIAITAYLNTIFSGADAEFYFIWVTDDYRLYKFEP